MFTELIAASDVIIGKSLMAKGLGRLKPPCALVWNAPRLPLLRATRETVGNRIDLGEDE